MFCITLKDSFPGSKSHFCLKVHKLIIVLHSSRRSFYAIFVSYVSMSLFVVWIRWPELHIYSQGQCLFNKFENIIHELSFNRFPYFTDFEIKIVLLGQNSFK